MFKHFFLLVNLSVLFIYAGEFQETVDQFGLDLLTQATLDNSKNLAVIPFESTVEKGDDGQLGVAFAEFLVGYINQNSDITIVDRADLRKIVDEQTFSNSDMVDDATRIQLGKLGVAKYLVTGKVASSMGRYMVSAKIIDTETSEILSSVQTSLSIPGTQGAMEQLYEEKSYPLTAAFRSTLIPGWGQVYAGEPVHAAVSGIICASGLAVTIVSGVQKNSAWGEYTDFTGYKNTPDFNAELKTLGDDAIKIMDDKEDSLYQAYQDKNKQFSIAAGITGGLWALNIIDAIIMGKRAEKKFSLYFSSNPFAESYGVKFAYNF